MKTSIKPRPVKTTKQLDLLERDWSASIKREYCQEHKTFESCPHIDASPFKGMPRNNARVVLRSNNVLCILNSEHKLIICYVKEGINHGSN